MVKRCANRCGRPVHPIRAISWNSRITALNKAAQGRLWLRTDDTSKATAAPTAAAINTERTGCSAT